MTENYEVSSQGVSMQECTPSRLLRCEWSDEVYAKSVGQGRTRARQDAAYRHIWYSMMELEPIGAKERRTSISGGGSSVYDEEHTIRFKVRSRRAPETHLPSGPQKTE